MSEFITWELLGTFAGMVTAVCLLTEVVKRYIAIDPKWIALIAAALCSAGVQFFWLGDVSPGGIFMMLVNAVAVTGAAIGMFEGVLKKFTHKGE